MTRDPKNAFYRTLDLGKEESEILRWYRKNLASILNDAEKKINIEEEKDGL